MAIYTRISRADISFIEKKFNLGKIISFKGIKKVEIIKENVIFKTPGKLN